MTMKLFEKPLVIFEMANNHMGDLTHGIKIVHEFKKIVEGIEEFDFSIKLQHRDDSFFHPDHINRKDHKLIKRFVETRLGDENFRKLTEEIKNCGFLTMCTPWDEPSVDLMEELNFDIIKIASCSFNDWPLLERVVKSDKPIIASTAGAHLDEIDQIISFLSHREKCFAIMHCVGEYPCPRENLELNQIDLFHNRYPDIPIGFSTHEDPANLDSIRIAIAKNAILFEKHIGLATGQYQLNQYSATPEQARLWIESAIDTYKMCGVKGKRKSFTEKEMYDLGILYRGAYASEDIKKGERIDEKSYFLAMPNIEGQVVAKNISKYTEFIAEKDFRQGEPLMLENLKVKELRKQVLEIVNQLRAILKESKVALPPYVDCEISYHYGIERFNESGAVLIKILNREYSKILLVMMPDQSYPEHSHIQKDESFHILYGDLTVNINGKVYKLTRGGLLSINRGQSHTFHTDKGVVIEEIATTYIVGDSIYSDEIISINPNRKTYLTFWPEWMEG
jgi:sialic acid synthase SpsE/mannose-6-phosphate isomerase-like protein (cupin superfamily)